ncbi:MAG: HAMP domain-containing sensor histidine kinase [Bacteroidota bacterium]
MKDINIYSVSQRWKFFLVFLAFAIVSASLWYTNTMVKKIASDERKKAKLWANAIERKALLVSYTDELFKKIKADERSKIELWASAYHRLLSDNSANDLTFYINIISSNKNIPTILTDKNNKIISSINLNIDDSLSITKLENSILVDSLKKSFTQHEPIEVKYRNKTLSFIYYKDSKLLSELQKVMNDLIKSFLSEIVLNSASVPVIITDSTKENIIAFGNLDSTESVNPSIVKMHLASMAAQNKPIEIQLDKQSKNYIFYENSLLFKQLRFFPFIQFGIIGLFLFVSYLVFSNSRKAEQNQVWAGMARETAHQLGTPLSSLMAWFEYLREKGLEESVIREIEKDLSRLGTITERFSKIGSEPELYPEDINKTIADAIDYIKARTSKKVEFDIQLPNHPIIISLNVNLFNWVIENISKNAIDAMEGKGKISISLIEELKSVTIDISDTGKGIPKRKFKTIFKPGFTTKKRGWGLGLSLTKRIVENYHSGKIFVKQSTPDKGTTFRIALNKAE